MRSKLRALHFMRSVQVLKRLIVLIILAIFLTFWAYQAKFPLYVNIGDNDQKFVRGFYYSPEDKPVPARWTTGDSQVILRDSAVQTPLTIVLRASAYRWADHIYTTTVTLNSYPVGVIDRANWRTWRFEVKELPLSTEELIIGLQSQTFVPSELSPEYTDERELGILVDWVMIEPQWSGRLVFPPSRQLFFVVLLAGGVYLMLCALSVSENWGFYLALGAVIIFVGIILFYRIIVDELIILGGLAVGLLAFVQAIKGVKASIYAQILIIGIIAGLALVLRWHAAGLLPVEHDDSVYMNVAKHYAQAIQQGDFGEIAAFEHHTGHPILGKLVLTISLLARDALRLPLTELETMRGIVVIFGVLQVILLASLNPIAGWFLATQTTVIKFTSIAYLEAVPAFTSLMAIIAFDIFRRTAKQRWLVLSGIALGATAACKFIYLNAGMAIIILLLWEFRRQWKIILLYLAIVTIVFFLLNPYLWADPIGRFLGMFFFHFRSVQDDFVKQYARPWWYNLVTLMRPAVVFPSITMERPPIFFFRMDTLVYLAGVCGILTLVSSKRLYLIWLCCGALFLSLWGAKWEQYAMIIAAPLCLSAGWGLTKLACWLQTHWFSIVRYFGSSRIGISLIVK